MKINPVSAVCLLQPVPFLISHGCVGKNDAALRQQDLQFVAFLQVIAYFNERSFLSLITVQDNSRRFMGLNVFDLRTGFLNLLFGKGKAGCVAAVRDFLQFLEPLRIALVFFLFMQECINRLPVGSGDDRHIVG